MPFAGVGAGTWLGLGEQRRSQAAAEAASRTDSAQRLIRQSLALLKKTHPQAALAAEEAGKRWRLSAPSPSPGDPEPEGTAVSLAAQAVRAAGASLETRAWAWGWCCVIFSTVSAAEGTPLSANTAALGDLVTSGKVLRGGSEAVDDAARAAQECAFWARAQAARTSSSQRADALAEQALWERRAADLRRLLEAPEPPLLSAALPRGVTLNQRLAALRTAYATALMESRSRWGAPAPSLLPALTMEALSFQTGDVR